jgi:hypothetical protein
MEYWWNDYYGGKSIARGENPVPLPLCPPQQALTTFHMSVCEIVGTMARRRAEEP